MRLSTTGLPSTNTVRRARSIECATVEPRAGRRRFARLGASQHGAGPGRQFLGIERLRQVVVGAKFQAHILSESVPLAVNKITGTPELSRSVFSTLRPSMPGI